MRTTTSDLKSVIMSDESPAPLQRRSFLGRFGGMLAGLLAGLPLIHGSMLRADDASATPPHASGGSIQARIHPMAVPRASSRSLPNV